MAVPAIPSMDVATIEMATIPVNTSPAKAGSFALRL
jgi:hypothetical protein